MAVVIFDPDEWRLRFPNINGTATSSLSDEVLQQAFDIATLIIGNKDKDVVPYEPDDNIFDRKTLLYLLVCHIITLALWSRYGQGGPITSGTEGSVSASFAIPQNVNGRWFNQTPCGQTLWLALARYRLGGRYIDCHDRFHPWG